MSDQYREPVEEVKPEKVALPIASPLQKETPVFSPEPEKERALEENFAREAAPPPVAPLPPPVPAEPALVARDISVKQTAESLRGFEKNQQLKSLVDLAFEKGVHYATEVVKDLDNPYLLDEFHDILVDELHKKLVERGKLEEI